MSPATRCRGEPDAWERARPVRRCGPGSQTSRKTGTASWPDPYRLHHQGAFDVKGDADDPDGLVFTDRKGRRLMGCGRPAPPGDTVITGNWTPPSGERLDSWMVTLDEVPVDA